MSLELPKSGSGRLALLGGPKSTTEPFAFYRSFGREEVEAVQKVVESGVLSKFIGAWGEDFYGGEKVKEFENRWAEFFQVPHAVTVNSNTSGLMCALGAVGIEPGDEVILSPWTMSADAAAILVWNAIPVFADIETTTFNLDPRSIESKITERTKAILVTDIFGQAAQLDSIMAIAKKHKIKVIEDCAQAPGALYKNKYVGTVADIGVFSLNYHKHIHTGEGGVCVTRDAHLAERMQLIRNHAESVVARKPTDDLRNLIGFNFRMGEMEAALGIEQLKKLPALARTKTKSAEDLTARLLKLKGLRPPPVMEDCTHVYYMYVCLYDETATGVPRTKIIQALEAEGLPAVRSGYTNIHLLPMFEKRIAYGSKGFPWTMPGRESSVTYGRGTCPVAERLNEQMIGLLWCSYQFDEADVERVAKIFEKVWDHLEDLA